MGGRSFFGPTLIRAGLVGATLFFVLGVAQQAQASIFYDWFPESGSSSGFIEFDDAAIGDPNNFSNQPIVAGSFNINLSIFDSAFDLLAPFPSIPAASPSSNAFEATGGVITDVSFVINTQSLTLFIGVGGGRTLVSCSNFTIVPALPGDCGASAPFVGRGVDAFGEFRRRLPIPEPGSLALFGAGLVSLAVLRRRVRRTKVS